MKTFGIAETQTLVSLELDADGHPMIDILKPAESGDDWIAPTLLPLVKLPKPDLTDTQEADPVLVWGTDSVERQWIIRPKTAEELRKVWQNTQSFMAAFTMQEKAAIALSIDPIIAALRLELTTWLSSVRADSDAVLTGLDKLVELQILTLQRKTEILATAT